MVQDQASRSFISPTPSPVRSAVLYIALSVPSALPVSPSEQIILHMPRCRDKHIIAHQRDNVRLITDSAHSGEALGKMDAMKRDPERIDGRLIGDLGMR